MVKQQNPAGRIKGKGLEERFQSRLKDMVLPQDDLPASISIRQADELIKRVKELEEKLADQTSEVIPGANSATAEPSPISTPSASDESSLKAFPAAAFTPLAARPVRFPRLARFWIWLTGAHPSIQDAGDRQQAQLAAAISLGLAVFTLFGFIGGIAAHARIINSLLLLALTVLIAGMYVVTRGKSFKVGSAAVVLIFLTGGYILAISEPGRESFGLYSMLPIALILGSLLLPLWGLGVITGINFLAVILLPTFISTYKFSDAITDAGLFLTLGILLVIAVAYRNSVERLRVAEVTSVNRELQVIQSSLEQRAQDRTHDLELAAKVGRTITEKVDNLGEMLTSSVEIIRARFNLYYTQVYLTDPTGKNLILHAGTGQVGEQLHMRGHHLPLNASSLNGRAALDRKAVIVADTALSPAFRPNPLLPKTRSEMAIPLIAGEQVIGVLDMQSEIPGSLNELNLSAFEVLAGQLSVAIQNTSLFAQAREAREQVEATARSVTKSGWQDLLNGIDRSERFGYSYDQKETVVVHELSGSNSSSCLSIPITITGAEVGKIQATQENRVWTQQEQQILETTAARLGQRIENLRLLAQAERYQADAEQAVRRLTRQGWESYQTTQTGTYTGFTYDLNDVKPLEEGSRKGSSDSAIRQSLLVRDEAIGELEVDLADLPAGAGEVLAAVAEQLSGHIENLRLSEETAESLVWQQAINRASEMIGTAKTIEDIVRGGAELLPFLGMVSCSAAVIREEDSDGKPKLGDIHVIRYINNRFEAMPPMLGQEISTWMTGYSSYYQENRIVVLPDLKDMTSIVPSNAVRPEGPVAFLLKVGMRSAVALGLGVRNKAIGYLTFASQTPLVHQPERYIERLGNIADLVSTAIDRQMLFEQTQSALGTIQNSEARLSEALDIARLANWEYDVERDRFTFNDHFYSIFHTNAEQMGGYELSSADYAGRLVHPEDVPVVGAAIEKALASSDKHYNTELEHRVIYADGGTGYISVVIHIERDEQGKILRYYGANQDITERKLAQEILAKRALELETVAQVSATTSTVLDPDRLLQTIVDLTKERFGVYHAHIYLVNDAWQTLILAAGAGEMGRKMVAEEHTIALNAEKSLVARSARERQAVMVNDVRADPGFLPNPLLPETHSEMAVPMIVGDMVLGVFDVQSDRINGFSDEDASIYTTLASQVAVALQNARLFVEQAATVTQLRELDRLKTSFLANMSHELRTPLNSILGFADVILGELDGPLTENMTTDLQLIHKNGQHLLSLINNVLDMAKIEAGKMSLSLEKFRLYDVIKEVINISSPMVSDNEVTLEIEEDSDQETIVEADRIRIRQVMLNLVGNAIKFTDKGKIRVRTDRQDDNVIVAVCDSGIGIPPDKLEAIFQEFTQVDVSSTRKVGGTGLGLPISRRLVEIHGGRIWAESTGMDGQGSTFFFELPIHARVSEPIEKQEK